MQSWLVRAEGVNFSATVFETNDLSTIRGASLTLLRLDRAVESALRGLSGVQGVEVVFAGASQVAVRLSDAPGWTAETLRAEVVAALAASQDLPLRHMVTVVDVVAIPTPTSTLEPDGAEAIALKTAEARNRSRQFRQWTLDPLPFTGQAVDVSALEQGRPGEVEGPNNGHLSQAVNAKRQYGRTARQQFYGQELGEDAAVRVTDSLQDLASVAGMDAEARSRIPLSMRGKLALIYVDGNGFGAIRDAVGVRRFSTELKALRQDLLRGCLDWFRQRADRQDAGADLVSVVDPKAQKRVLRLETLLWGGDELLFAVPAWLALPFTGVLFDRMKGWAIDGMPLTHSAAVAVAHHKTPVRQLRRVAKQAADLAKDAGLRGVNAVTVEVFESLAPPDEEQGLLDQRQRRYGGDSDALARWLALPGEALTGLCQAAEQRAATALPPSQAHAALRAATGGTRPLTSGDALAAAQKSLTDYARRSGWVFKETEGLKETERKEWRLPCVGAEAGTRPLTLDLAMGLDLADLLPAPALWAMLGGEEGGVE